MSGPDMRDCRRTAPVVSGVVVFLLLWLSASHPVFPDFTKDSVRFVLSACGLDVLSSPDGLMIGSVFLPWTADCSGSSILAVVWALVLWSYRQSAHGRSFWLRMFLALPVAWLANVLRVLSLLSYRMLFYPAVEAPSLHYFFGFAWILPVLPWFCRTQRDKESLPLLRIIHTAVCLSLATVSATDPGGWLIVATSLLLIIEADWSQALNKKGHLYRLIAWCLLGAWLGISGMESFWLPWLLLNPWAYTRWPRRSIFRPLLALGTLPLVTIHIMPLTLLALVFLSYLIFTHYVAAPAAQHTKRPWSYGQSLGLCAVFVIPLIAPALPLQQREAVHPPAAIVQSRQGDSSYALRLIGQPEPFSIFYFMPPKDGRHHSLKQCLLFRGIEIKPLPAGSVWTDGQRWLAEYFLVEGELLESYPQYLLRTFLPFSASGVHLIIESPRQSMSETVFKEFADKLAQRIRNLVCAN